MSYALQSREGNVGYSRDDKVIDFFESNISDSL